MNKELLKISAFVILYLVIVPITITNATSTVKRAYYSMSLEKAKGKIISSNVEKELHKNILGEIVTSYRAHLTYVYKVDGESYLGRGIEFEDLIFDTLKEAKVLIVRYPIGTRVPILYSSINPDKSVISKPKTIRPLLATLAGLLATVIMTIKVVFFILSGKMKELKEELKKPLFLKPEKKPLAKEESLPIEIKKTTLQSPAPIDKPEPIKVKPLAIDKQTKELTPKPTSKTPAYNPNKGQVKTGLKPSANQKTEKIVIKKPTANPLSLSKASKEAKPKIATSTSLKPSASKAKKPWYKF